MCGCVCEYVCVDVCVSMSVWMCVLVCVAGEGGLIWNGDCSIIMCECV